MKYPDYLKEIAKKKQEEWENNLEFIIKTEEDIIRNNLEILYHSYDIMNKKFIPSPLLTLFQINQNGIFVPHIVMPKYFATQELEFYWAELIGVDTFISSLSKYGEPMSGLEIVEESSKKSLNTSNTFYNKLNTVLRKFLSYQYITTS